MMEARGSLLSLNSMNLIAQRPATTYRVLILGLSRMLESRVYPTGDNLD